LKNLDYDTLIVNAISGGAVSKSREPVEISRGYILIKRTLDIIVAIAAFLILSPVFLITSVLIMIHDGRPIFFTQERLGADNRVFKCFKFRSMKKNCPSYVKKCDLENSELFITSFGRRIRALSIDELPQLYNVLKGDMSLVGPRPMIGAHRFIHEARSLYGVNRLKPGITGLAQVMGRDVLDDEEKIKYDKFYFDNLSFGLDLWILLKTVKVVLFRDGYKEGK
jgi:O-antigen biosynthesis protein WbqP